MSSISRSTTSLTSLRFRAVRVAFLLALAPFLFHPVSAQSQFPDTPAARQFSSWLAAFNSGDRATLLEYLQKNDPPHASAIDHLLDFRNRTGGFDFKKAEDSAPTRFSGTLKERGSDQFARFTIEVEAAEPHLIRKFDLNAIATPAEFAAPRLTQEATLAALGAKLDKDSAAGKIFWRGSSRKKRQDRVHWGLR